MLLMGLSKAKVISHSVVSSGTKISNFPIAPVSQADSTVCEPEQTPVELSVGSFVGSSVE